MRTMFKHPLNYKESWDCEVRDHRDKWCIVIVKEFHDMGFRNVVTVVNDEVQRKSH